MFLAALALHKAFIAAQAIRFRRNLGALMDILDGKGRPPDHAVLAAWQTLFLVVPVVSTTFASMAPLFAGLGRESVGWLFIDEAGQAAPQQATGQSGAPGASWSSVTRCSSNPWSRCR